MIVEMLFNQLHTKEVECELWQQYYNEFGETVLRELANERNVTNELNQRLIKHREHNEELQHNLAVVTKSSETYKKESKNYHDKYQQLTATHSK